MRRSRVILTHLPNSGALMLRALLWIVGIIFLIGLLVVTGFFKLIF
ncbi:MAG TPA: hypothetical protein VIQ62_00070 [Burkholderiales bacterium]